jgi:hypothetical protein
MLGPHKIGERLAVGFDGGFICARFLLRRLHARIDRARCTVRGVG